MRHFPFVLLILAGLNGHCFAAGEQAVEIDVSTTRAEEPATGSEAGQRQDEKKKDNRKQSSGGEEEPECE